MTKQKRTLIEAIKSRFSNNSNYADRYLSNAVSLEDLERRQRELMARGL